MKYMNGISTYLEQLRVKGGIGIVTSYLTQMSIKNDSSQGRLLLCGHDPKLGSFKDQLGSLEEVKHGCYLPYLLK